MIKFQGTDREKIKEIKKLMERADVLFNDLYNSTKEICDEYHNEFTLGNCIYYGLTACEELLDRKAKIDE